MAIRQIRTIGDEILTKECKPVKEMNERTLEPVSYTHLRAHET